MSVMTEAARPSRGRMKQNITFGIVLLVGAVLVFSSRKRQADTKERLATELSSLRVPPNQSKLRIRSDVIAKEPLPDGLELIKGEFKRKKPPKSHEWLANHHEAGQTFAQFKSRYTPLNRNALTLDIVLIGDFTKGEEKTLKQTENYMQAVFGLKIRRLKPVSDSIIPESARRKNPQTGQLQFLTPWIFENILKSKMSASSVAVIGFTATDLYPTESWNYVFGVASYTERIGVWSIARFGHFSKNPRRQRQFLKRTLGTAVHESCHIMGLAHCISWDCMMNGVNNLAENDRSPVLLCPNCKAKLSYRLGYPVRESWKNQRQVWKDLKWDDTVSKLDTLLKLTEEQH